MLYQSLSHNNSNVKRGSVLPFVLITKCLLILFSTQAFSSESKNVELSDTKLSDSVALENAYFKVMRNRIACSKENTPGYGARVIVALAEVKIISCRGTLQLERGGVAVFLPDEYYSEASGDFFEIAIKSDHPPIKAPGQWIEPLKNNTVFEDDEFRVFEERLAPGDDRELHSHAQRIVVRLNEVQLTDPRLHENGLPGQGIQVPNTVRFAEPVVHAVRNLSKNTPLFNIVIEYKVRQ